MKNNNLRKNRVFNFIAVFALFLLQSNFIYAQDAIVNALPHGAVTINGTTGINYAGHNLNVTASNNAIINWNSYNIGQINTVNYIQPSASSVVLNRVVGINPSSIYGALNANGRVFIVNPNGIFFGPHSQINVSALLASTLNISNSDFLAGNYNFAQNGKSAWIINQGNIHIANGGYVLLLSNTITNTGLIEAKLGRVLLAAGEKMTVALDDDSDVSVVIDDAVSHDVFGPDGAKITQAIQNTGSILADGGTILLNARILNGIFDNAINNAGVVQANSLVNKNGTVELVANGGDISSSKGSIISAKAADSTAQGGSITLNSTNNINIQNGAFIDVSGGSQSGNGGFVNLNAMNAVDFAGTVNGKVAQGYAEGSIDIDPATASVSGTYNANTTIWATGDITIAGATTIGSGVTLNIFADNTSGASAAWNAGTGAITDIGNFTISAAVAGSGILNLQAGNGIGSLANPILVSGLSSVSANMDPSGSNGVDISNSGSSDLNIASVSTHNGDLNLSSASSSINFLGNTTLGTGNVTLSSGNLITQIGSIKANTLNVTDTTGSTTLTNSSNAFNLLGSINAAGQTFSLAYNIIVPPGTSGGLTQTGALLANVLNISTNTGSITLNNSGNAINVLGTITVKPSQNISITDNVAGGLTQTGALSAGIFNLTNTASNTDLSSQNNVIANLGVINAGNNSFSFKDTEALTQTGALTANLLSLTNTVGNTTLNNSGNAINVLGTVNAAGRTFSLTDNVAGGLTQTGVLAASILNLTNTAGNTNLGSQNNVIANLGTINAGNNSFSVSDTEALGQTGALIANLLSVINTSGATTLNNSGNAINVLGTIDAAGQTFSLTDNVSGGLTQTGLLAASTLNLTNIASNTDLSTRNNVISNLGTINAGANSFLLDNTGLLGETGSVIAGNLLLEGNGTFNLNGSNNVGTLAANIAGGSLVFTNNGTLTVGSVGGINGITDLNNNVTLNTGNQISIAQNINAGTGIITLNPTSGGVDQSSGALTANGLLLTGSGPDILNNINNKVTTIAANINGPLFYTDTGTLVVGTVGGIDGITSSNNDITLTAAGDLTTGAINAGTADVNLTSTHGNVLDDNNDLTFITGSHITINSNGDIGADPSHNGFDPAFVDINGAALVSGGLTVNAPNGNVYINFIGGHVATSKIGALNYTLGGTVALAASQGSLTIDSGLFGGAGANLSHLYLDAAGGINQTGGAITVDDLLLTGTGPDVLTDPTNNVGTLAANINGPLSFTNVNALTVGTVGGVSGITSTNNDITLSTGSTLTLDNDINAGTGNVNLTAITGSILDNGSTITGNTIGVTAGSNIGSSTNAVITNSSFLNVNATGDVNLDATGSSTEINLDAGGSANLLTNNVTLDTVTTGGDFTLEALTGNILLNGTLQSTGGAVNLTSDNGSLDANPGANVVAQTDSLFSVPNGTIGLTNPVNVNINGNLTLNIGSETGGVSGFLTGIVDALATSVPLISSLNPPGDVFFNGVRIWPLAVITTSPGSGTGSNQSLFALTQSSGGILDHFVFPDLEKLAFIQINTFNPSTSSDQSGGGSLFLYHPLMQLDSGAFDQEFQLDEGAYDFIDGQILKKAH